MHRLAPVAPGLAACLAACVTLGACAAPRVGNSRRSVDSWLVWSSTDGGTTTQWLDAAGTVVGQADGLIVAQGGQLYRVEWQKVAVPTMSCDAQNAAENDAEAPAEPAAPSEDGSSTRVVLVPLTGGAPIDVVAASTPEAATDGGDTVVDAEYTHAAVISAGLGPFLFVQESTYSYSCGAHGGSSDSASVFDLSSNQTVTLVDEASLGPSRDKARAALIADSDGDDLADPSDAETEIHLAASVPTWTDGSLAMRHLFWIDACYACSDGAWSSYTRTTRVDDPALPLAFAALPPVPAPVAAWLSSHGEPRGVSWGTAATAWINVLPAPKR